MDRIKINIDIRNKVQAAADEFARKYNQKSARRTTEFEKDIEKLRVVMNDQRLVLLELDAYRKNKPTYTDRDLRKAFVDFVEFQ
jgi:precorrin-3B methylase